MKEFIVEIESINGKIQRHVYQVDENNTSVEGLEGYIATYKSRFFKLGDTLINLDNVFSIKVSENTTDNNKDPWSDIYHAHNIQFPPR